MRFTQIILGTFSTRFSNVKNARFPEGASEAMAQVEKLLRSKETKPKWMKRKLIAFTSFWTQVSKDWQWKSSTISKLPFCEVRFSSSRPLKRRDIALTDGAVDRSQMPSLIKRSRISHEKIPGFSFLYSSMRFSISGVAIRGFEPPITPGLGRENKRFKFAFTANQSRFSYRILPVSLVEENKRTLLTV